jgi:hypothetical protein
VLIFWARHHEPMVFAYFLIAFIVLIGPLAVVAGKDSRLDENDRLRHYRG